MAPGHALGLAQARSCFRSFWKGSSCRGAKREQPHAHEHCCAGWLEFQSYYLNRFTGADRVTWHEDLLLDRDTAADVKPKTRNFAGVCCYSSLCQCYLVWFVSMLVKFNGKFRVYTFNFWVFLWHPVPWNLQEPQEWVIWSVLYRLIYVRSRSGLHTVEKILNECASYGW